MQSSNATPVLKQCQSVLPVLMQDSFRVCVWKQINPNQNNVKVQLFYGHCHIWNVLVLSSDRAEGSCSDRWPLTCLLYILGESDRIGFWEIHLHAWLHFKYFARTHDACILNFDKRGITENFSNIISNVLYHRGWSTYRDHPLCLMSTSF